MELLWALLVATSPSLRVMAYNVLYDAENIDASIALIQETNPDILCLTELTSRFEKRLLSKLGKTYLHRASKPKPGTWGVAIVSKYPILKSDYFPQKPYRIPAMQVNLQINGRRLTVACLHFMPPGAVHDKRDGLLDTLSKNEALREGQAEYLIARYRDLKSPLILAGDLNEERGGRALDRLEDAGFVAACDAEEEDCGPTWPGATSLFPAITQVDHVFGRGLRFVAAKVPSGGGSDHFPIFADFEWQVAK